MISKKINHMATLIINLMVVIQYIAILLLTNKFQITNRCSYQLLLQSTTHIFSLVLWFDVPYGQGVQVALTLFLLFSKYW